MLETQMIESQAALEDVEIAIFDSTGRRIIDPSIVENYLARVPRLVNGQLVSPAASE